MQIFVGGKKELTRLEYFIQCLYLHQLPAYEYNVCYFKAEMFSLKAKEEGGGEGGAWRNLRGRGGEC